MNLRSLKILVAVLGMLLVAGVVGLVVAISMRLSHQAAPPVAAFTAPPVTLPQGAKIEAVGAGPDRIVLDMVLLDGTRQLIILDATTGRQIGTVPLRQQ
jgi:uncharacterized protein DUF6476